MSPWAREYQHQHLAQSRFDLGLWGMLGRRLLHRPRLWDHRTANGVDRIVANSRLIARRMWSYRSEAAVIHPPIDVGAFRPGERRGEHHLGVSGFVPYKRTELIVEPFRTLPDRSLVVTVHGPGFRRAREQAPANVTQLGDRRLSARAASLLDTLGAKPTLSRVLIHLHLGPPMHRSDAM